MQCGSCRREIVPQEDYVEIDRNDDGSRKLRNLIRCQVCGRAMELADERAKAAKEKEKDAGTHADAAEG